jgi:hypothetical protein
MVVSSPASRPSPSGGLRPALTPAPGTTPGQLSGEPAETRSLQVKSPRIQGNLNHHATPDTLQRRFLSTPGTIITNSDDTITVHLDRRTYSPILRQADLPDTTIPWSGNHTLHFEYH